ncbi:hypothetical protein NQZ68_007484 [Dissostichus eleginoides]|nr:hypothetical protein NQZ68_007484 [Dissostichus eleginoides]
MSLWAKHIPASPHTLHPAACSSCSDDYMQRFYHKITEKHRERCGGKFGGAVSDCYKDFRGRRD